MTFSEVSPWNFCLYVDELHVSVYGILTSER
jgi:hypothetical protein